jgi:hypothetical protein
VISRSSRGCRLDAKGLGIGRKRTVTPVAPNNSHANGALAGRIEALAPSGASLADIDLNWADRHVLFGGLPKLAIDKIGGDAAHERELLGLARMDFKSTRLKGCEGVPH